MSFIENIHYYFNKYLLFIWEFTSHSCHMTSHLSSIWFHFSQTGLSLFTKYLDFIAVLSCNLCISLLAKQTHVSPPSRWRWSTRIWLSLLSFTVDSHLPISNLGSLSNLQNFSPKSPTKLESSKDPQRVSMFEQMGCHHQPDNYHARSFSSPPNTKRCYNCWRLGITVVHGPKSKIRDKVISFKSSNLFRRKKKNRGIQLP